jgi:Flagellar biosynthesis protein, FliO
MNLKISVDRPSQHRTPRKPISREPKALDYASAAGAAGNSLTNYPAARKIEALRRQQVARRLPRPKLAEPVVVPQPSLFSRAFGWLRVGNAVPKQLQVVETLPLGEKRFVAILNVEGRKLLIGGGASGVALLTQLDDSTEDFDEMDALDDLSESAE